MVTASCMDVSKKPGNRSYIEGVRRQGYRQDFEEGSERGGHKLDL